MLGRDLDHVSKPRSWNSIARARAFLSSVLLTARITGRPNSGPAARSPRSPGTRPSLRVHDQHDQVGRRERLQPVLDDERVQGIGGGAEQPAGVHQREVRDSARTPAPSAGRASCPATGATIDRRVPVMRLNRVDLPTFGRPTSTTVDAVRLCDMQGVYGIRIEVGSAGLGTGLELEMRASSGLEPGPSPC